MGYIIKIISYIMQSVTITYNMTDCYLMETAQFDNQLLITT